jgi:hypothetical protein
MGGEQAGDAAGGLGEEQVPGLLGMGVADAAAVGGTWTGGCAAARKLSNVLWRLRRSRA